jgi:hypothetical protein
MKTFRLDAIETKRSSPHWGCSSLPPGTVWVSANDQEEAREKVTTATVTGRRSKPGDESPLPPWKQRDLVTCTVEPTRMIAADVVIAASGTVLELPN